MSEQHFREIQLSGKQLVFLFMTSVVVAVAVFLLGVSVGRGVGASSGGVVETADESASVALSAEPPPPTELRKGDTDYHLLQGTSTPPAEPQPESVADEPAEEPPAPAPEVRPQPAAVAAPVTTPPPAPATQKPAAAVTDGWFVQVGAYRSRSNAEGQARSLAAKGYAASVVPAVAGGLYRVRVGPFAARAEAESNASRLRSEERLGSSSVTR